MSLMRIDAAILALLILTAPLFCQPSVSANLALTPPMGWNSWNKFGCNVSDEMIHGMDGAMVKSGMKDAGYQYIVIDDCWQVSRDAHGDIVADPQRFPSGVKALADQQSVARQVLMTPFGSSCPVLPRQTQPEWSCRCTR